MPKFMLISYVFPPSGGAGVQRALKLVKYIVRHGWQPVVITPQNASSPVQDDSYARDLPTGLLVERLPTFEPRSMASESNGHPATSSTVAHLGRLGMELLFPDRHVIWLVSALPGALAAARRHRVKAVVVTGPPFSSFLLGRAVAALVGLPLVLDFRDDWSGFFSKGFTAHGGGPLWKRSVLSLERCLVRAANRVVATTPAICRRLQRLHGGPKSKFVWIPNGYDPADYAFIDRYPPPPPPHDGRLHLLYAGTVFQSHPLRDLWAGMALLEPAERKRLSVEIMGRAVPGQTLDPGLPGLEINALPYLPHDEALQRMALADVLVMTLAGIPGLERMVPAKLYEHLALRRPTLAISPPGEATAILDACEAGQWLRPGDSEGIARVLRRWLEQPPVSLGPPPRLFDRTFLSDRWARLLNETILEGS